MTENEFLKAVSCYCNDSYCKSQRIMQIAMRGVEASAERHRARLAAKDQALLCAISLLDSKRMGKSTMAMLQANLLKGLTPPEQGASAIEKEVWAKCVEELQDGGYLTEEPPHEPV